MGSRVLYRRVVAMVWYSCDRALQPVYGTCGGVTKTGGPPQWQRTLRSGLDPGWGGKCSLRGESQGQTAKGGIRGEGRMWRRWLRKTKRVPALHLVLKACIFAKVLALRNSALA